MDRYRVRELDCSPAWWLRKCRAFLPRKSKCSTEPTLLDSLDARVAGVSLSDTQGNAIFQNVRYHGFEASPLQGNAQGLAVYQNGIRLNEAFGDTVNWDAIPSAAIDRTDVWSSNPVFGLNALGGAVNLIMKDGFRWQGATTSVQAAPYGQSMAVLQYGNNDGRFGFYERSKALPMAAGAIIPRRIWGGFISMQDGDREHPRFTSLRRGHNLFSGLLVLLRSS
jgi:hypothetical protein